MTPAQLKENIRKLLVALKKEITDCMPYAWKTTRRNITRTN